MNSSFNVFSLEQNLQALSLGSTPNLVNTQVPQIPIVSNVSNVAAMHIAPQQPAQSSSRKRRGGELENRPKFSHVAPLGSPEVPRATRPARSRLLAPAVDPANLLAQAVSAFHFHPIQPQSD